MSQRAHLNVLEATVTAVALAPAEQAASVDLGEVTEQGPEAAAEQEPEAGANLVVTGFLLQKDQTVHPWTAANGYQRLHFQQFQWPPLAEKQVLRVVAASMNMRRDYYSLVVVAEVAVVVAVVVAVAVWQQEEGR